MIQYIENLYLSYFVFLLFKHVQVFRVHINTRYINNAWYLCAILAHIFLSAHLAAVVVNNNIIIIILLYLYVYHLACKLYMHILIMRVVYFLYNCFMFLPVF